MAETFFNIPAQPLASALDAYSAATGIVAAYNGNLALGRISNEVKGRLAPQAALEHLLRDTGLVAQYTTPGAFVVVPDPASVAVIDTPLLIANAALSQQDADEQSYSGLLQDHINNALCSQQLTRPGSYRLAINFHIGAAGEVAQLKMLNSTGNGERDIAIDRLLSHMSVGEAPPEGMAQPFTMIVLPRTTGGTVVCPSN